MTLIECFYESCYKYCIVLEVAEAEAEEAEVAEAAVAAVAEVAEETQGDPRGPQGDPKGIPPKWGGPPPSKTWGLCHP